MRQSPSRLLVPVVLLLAAPALAVTVAGVTVPDTVTVGGQSLVLNGTGLREFLGIDIYLGALYAPEKSKDATKLISEDVPKRISMHFIYGKGIPREKLLKAFRDGFAKQDNLPALQARVDRLEAMIEDVGPGQTAVLDYVPGTGVTVTFKGRTKGTIEGADFMRGLWTVFIGPHPPTKGLKKGMLGG